MILTLTGMSTSGKSTFAKSLSATPFFEEAVSLTTRKMRPGEMHGRDYYFVTQEQFEDHVEKGNLIEYVRSHHASYGVPAFEVQRIIEAGKSPVMVLEPEGVRAINRFAVKQSIDIISAYVDVPEDILVDRFFRRIEDQVRGGGDIDYFGHAKRLHTMITKERFWRRIYRWDMMLESLHVEGNLLKSKEQILKRAEEPCCRIHQETEAEFVFPEAAIKIAEIELLIRSVMNGSSSREKVREQLVA